MDRLRERILAEPNRRRVYEAVQRVPGIHVRRLERELGISMSTVQHHLRVLENTGLVSCKREGKRRSCFAADHIDRHEQHYLYFLRHRTSRRILLELLDAPASRLGELTQRVPVQAPTVAYHLKKLKRAGLVDSFGMGRGRVYDVLEPERVRGILDRFGTSFQPVR